MWLAIGKYIENIDWGDTDTDTESEEWEEWEDTEEKE